MRNRCEECGGKVRNERSHLCEECFANALESKEG